MVHLVNKNARDMTTLYGIMGAMIELLPEGTFTLGESSVLMSLAYPGSHEHGFSFAYMHQSRLAKRANMNKTSVSRAIRSLKDKGFVMEVEENVKLAKGDGKLFNGYDEKRHNAPKLYRFVWEKFMSEMPQEGKSLFLIEEETDKHVALVFGKPEKYKFLVEDPRTYKEVLSDLTQPERTNEETTSKEAGISNDTTPSITDATYNFALDVLFGKTGVSEAIEEARKLGKLDIKTWRNILSRDDRKLILFDSLIESFEKEESDKQKEQGEKEPELNDEGKVYDLIEQDKKKYRKFEGRSGYSSNLTALKRVRQGYDAAKNFKRTLVSTGSYIPEMWKDLLPNDWEMTSEEQTEFNEANE